VIFDVFSKFLERIESL